MQRVNAEGGEPRGKSGCQTKSGRRIVPCPDRRSFLINKKNKRLEEEKKGDDGGGKKKGDGGRSKRGKKKRGGIDGSVLKEKDGKDYGDADS